VSYLRQPALDDVAKAIRTVDAVADDDDVCVRVRQRAETQSATIDKYRCSLILRFLFLSINL